MGIWKKKFCLGLNPSCGISYEDQLALMKQAGFDAFFPIWEATLDLKSLMKKAAEVSMDIQSIHAPWFKAADIWAENEEYAQTAVQELKQCVDACVQTGAPILVVHAFIGFEDHTPTAAGLQRFAQVVDYARQKAIKIAFENTEGEEYLHALMERFAGDATVGFCWDSGHEMCYNRSKDLLALYGDRLLCTHLNDNLGIKAYDGTITFIDDLHLLPFDGVADWQDITQRLHHWNYTDILTFELNTVSKPDRHENDAYGQMPYVLYLAEAYKRACRVAALLIREDTTLPQTPMR